jgi:hypothetical protein
VAACRSSKRGPPQHDLRFRFGGIIPKAKGGERMLTVEDYELIRRKLLVAKPSIRAIAKELGHSRKALAKAARHAQPPGYQRATPRTKPAIDAYRPIIDAWLALDESRPMKQRHTAAR